MVESHLDVGGAVVFWSLAEGPTADRLRPALRRPRASVASSPTPGRPRPACGTPWRTSSAGPASWSGRWPPGTGSPSSDEDRGADGNAYATHLVARVRDGHDPDLRPVVARTPTGWPRRTAGSSAASRPCNLSARSGEGGRVPGRHPAAAGRGRVLGARHRLDDWARVAEAAEQAAEGRPSGRVRAAAPAGRRRRPGRPGRRRRRGPGRGGPDLRRGRGRRPGRPGPGDPEEAGGRPAGQGAAVRGPADRRPGRAAPGRRPGRPGGRHGRPAARGPRPDRRRRIAGAG